MGHAFLDEDLIFLTSNNVCPIENSTVIPIPKRKSAVKYRLSSFRSSSKLPASETNVRNILGMSQRPERVKDPWVRYF